ncbi:uncharacterized protein RCO7_14169 [Rhynchosporium graminicola]|uniref:Uncharacterized protein n=1 Tax=Rhynchosporium graminicola TaxID=2792576 RepID=A0A1E1JVR1_9HELO|nr:uncharacterized protein RCO7_14169 [Rhynchosporium commune]
MTRADEEPQTTEVFSWFAMREIKDTEATTQDQLESEFFIYEKLADPPDSPRQSCMEIFRSH